MPTSKKLNKLIESKLIKLITEVESQGKPLPPKLETNKQMHRMMAFQSRNP